MSAPSRVLAPRSALVALGILAILGAPPLSGQSQLLHEEGYLRPSSEIADLVTAPRHESALLTNLSPAGDRFLRTESDGLTPLADLALPFHRLGGLALDPAGSRARSLTTGGSARLTLIDWRAERTIQVEVPTGATVSGTRWSPDGGAVGFLVNEPGGSFLHVADAADGASRRLTERALLATRVTAFEWSGDGAHVYAVLVPEGRGPEPVRPAVPTTPLVRVAAAEENRLRTYPSLLQDPHDQALLEYHTTGQLARIRVADGSVQPIGSPAMIESIDVPPSGDHLRVRTTERPFSYIVPVSQFGDLDEIWDLEGTALAELERRAVREGAPLPEADADEEPRRSLGWHPDGGGLVFLQWATQGNDQGNDVDEADADGVEATNGPRLDRVVRWLPPFDDTAREVLFESQTEIRSLRFGGDASWLFLAERVRGTERLYAVHLDDPDTRYTLSEWDPDDFHANPGSLLTTTNALGASVVRTSSDGGSVYLSGTAHFEDPETNAPRAFVDRVEIASGERERIWEAAEDLFERLVAVVDDDLNEIILAREGPTTVPDSWLLDRRDGSLVPLTRNADPHPIVTQMRRERITVTRADGIRFKVNVTFPPDYPDYQEGTRLPAMFWFYPREYADQEAYDRSWRTYNPNRFVTAGPRSMDILAAAGYLVVEPDHPIVGPQERINDRFVVDLRQNHLAVIDALDERGWIDRRRLALGGHSYGGFGTINAMVHTPYFRAGIAGAPNTNRLLTPIGFQSERRALWDARETYLEMSPFLYAERLQGALLLYHGADDQNVGTFPDNSWRMIHALNGLGKTAALYVYPHEDHGPAAEETLLDLWARWVAWLDHYVKDAELDAPIEPVPLVADQDLDGDR